MAIPKPSFRRHILIASILLTLSQLASIYIIDVPKSIYHCPLNNNDRHRGLTYHFGSDENCYWSSSYAEAREKFVSLGNRLKEQVVLASNHNNNNNNGDDDGNNQEIVLNVVDVQSISYDIASHENYYPKFLTSIEASDVNTPQTVLPEKDTIDVLLLTIRIPESSSETNNNNSNNDEKKHNVNIIHVSGTHGIEGYIGSAVQSRFLHELFLDNEKRLTNNKNPRQNNAIPSSSSNDKVLRKVLLIHAVNPYGMRHHRRTNENNVDLNRNVLSDEMWSNVRKRDPNFVGYVDLDPMMNPFHPYKENGELFSWVDAAREGGFEGDVTKLRERDESVKNAAAAATAHESKDSQQQQQSTTTIGSSSLEEPTSTFHSWLSEQLIVFEAFRITIGAILNVGYTNAKRTLVASQYHKPSGIFYGGGAHNNDTWENSIFAVQHAIRTFAGFRFDDGSATTSSRAIFVDVHTGLGKWGEYSVLLHGPTDSSEISSSSSSCDDEPISDRRSGKLGDGTSPHASSADCTQNLDIQLFEDSPILTFQPDDASCKSGKVFVGTSVVGSDDNGGMKHITLVPNRGREGIFTASMNDDATGDIYSISPDSNGEMRTVKRNQREYAPEDEPPSSVAPPDIDDDDNDDTWTQKLISLLEETGMGYGQSGDASVSEGYDQSVGFLNDRVLCPPPHCFPFTQEFGTRP
mmetsp:Transcript_33245/g.63440  ORF Transcript_33245/g.63440 Transcript_33245/m.63440 type:complete len:691 (-) Transcript_33245:793-2865(-)|eukprot:CAMPEP_0201680578 /NCGR_PEP_ID=MMETSP0494-20130426/50670_1 /ASSEMBLY_ACC=CAM_ASM_000839 /TAXON_ID=420259 /ORGANISM="Thalassiosira gravida, Strain GMp14c1" /LENGTH=690 /DNA_ID=CAMNT_0048164301 /DNA_START=115 /DNA_END=2187 /DNA_ORIENTATION=+